MTDKESAALAFGDLILDPGTQLLSCSGACVRLSAVQFEVMQLLLQAGGRNLEQAKIRDQVWSEGSGATEKDVVAQVRRLRKKLERIGSGVTIKSVKREGYHLEEGGAPL